MDLVYIVDKQGNKVLPITHINAVRDSNGNSLSSLLPLTMGASGSNHSGGLVPDTPSIAGTSKFLREDGTWATPAGGTSSEATPSTNGVGGTAGLMSATDKEKLNSISTQDITTWNNKQDALTFNTTPSSSNKVATMADIPANLPANGGNASTVNNHSVASDVPANAVFTDTTYVFNTAYDASTNKAATMADIPSTLPASDVSSWAKQSSKPSYTYSEVGYTVNPVSNSSTTLSLDGITPIHVVTTTANITSLTLSSAPSDGHSCHIILTASAEKTVSIPATFTTVSSKTVVYPEGSGPIDLTIPAGGYVEVDFLTCGSKVFVRAI